MTEELAQMERETEKAFAATPGPASWWGVIGVGLLFAFAVVRLGGEGVATVRAGLGAGEWAALALLTALFVWGEGVRALGRRYVPWVVDRAERLPGRSLPVRILGPLYAMALVGASRRATVRAWLGTVAVAGAVAVVRALPPPWRGIVDLAVAAALLWGTVALVREVGRRWIGRGPVG